MIGLPNFKNIIYI